VTDWLSVLLTLLVAACGGLLGRQLKIPAGTMLGAILFTAVFQLLTDQAMIPLQTRPWLQMAAGLALGSGIRKRDIKELRLLIIPCLVMIVCMIILNLIFGVLMYRVSSLSLATALLATAPGGMTDMALIAGELGADMVQVTLLHLVRLLAIYALLPILFTRLRRYQTEHNICPAQTDPAAPTDQGTPVPDHHPGRTRLLNLLLTAVAAAAGGILLWQLGVNAGAMIGAMCAVAAVNLISGRAVRPDGLRLAVQILAGAFVGQNLNRASLGLMSALFLPVLVMIVSVGVFMLVLSLCLIWLSRLDRSTCILISAPGGLQEVSLMAIDLHADAPKVMVMQTTRLMVVIAFFPTLLAGVMSILER
jgi:hypothetical protein